MRGQPEKDDLIIDRDFERPPLIIPDRRVKTWENNPYRKEFDRMKGACFDPKKMPAWYHTMKPYDHSEKVDRAADEETATT